MIYRLLMSYRLQILCPSDSAVNTFPSVADVAKTSLFEETCIFVLEIFMCINIRI